MKPTVKKPAAYPFLDSWFDRLLNGEFFNDTFDNDFNLPAVNVLEKDNEVEIHVALPGLQREDIKIETDKNLLIVSSNKSAENIEEEEGKFKKKEYSFHSFKRTFLLPENVNREDIVAKYTNGELVLTVPKLEETSNSLKRIEVK